MKSPFLKKTFLLTGLGIFAFAFLSPGQITTQTIDHLSVISVSPQIGSSQPGEKKIFKARYFHPQGTDQINQAYIYFDVTQPQAKRIYSSAHGQIRKENSQWKFYGQRYNNGQAKCTTDQEPRHCYKNYSWDVGGFNIGDNHWIYFNHDEGLQDTILPTENTIGRYQAKAIHQIDNQTLEVEWEFVFGKFFLERELGIYLSLTDVNNQSLWKQNRPFWHQAGSWRVGKEASQLLFKEDFKNANLSGWGKFGRDGLTIVDNQHAYSQQQSVKIETDATKNGWQVLQKDFDENKRGRVTIYFWDDLTAQDNNFFYTAVSSKPYEQWDQPDAHTIAVAVNPSVSSQNYMYAARLEDKDGNHIHDLQNIWIDTGIKRTLGWHKVVFWVTEKGSWAELDDFEKEIYPYNLSSLPIETFRVEEETRRKNPLDWQMTNFRYIKIGSNNGGKFWVDNVVFQDLPQPPDINTLPGSKNWVLHWENIYLDSYEEIGMWNNLENWTREHVKHYDDIKPKSWWWQILSDLTSSHYYRYQLTGLPFDKDQGNKIWSFMLSEKNYYNNRHNNGGRPPWDDIGDIPLAATAGNTYLDNIGSGWDYMPDDLKIKSWEGITSLMDWYSSDDAECGEGRYIGDSTGENYSWGPLAGGAYFSVYFSNYYNADQWQKMSRKAAMSVFSDNPNEECDVCPGGKIGIQTIYAPGKDVSDCPNLKDITPADEAQDCLCQGDRGLLPVDHDFAYLFDNHDFHPHPGYAISAMDGATAAINFFKFQGISVPNEYYHNLKNVWDTHRKFINFKTGFYKGDNIYRIREKPLCDGDTGINGNNFSWNDRIPFDQDKENPFRQTGLDDWGSQAPITRLGSMKDLQDALGKNETKTSDGMDIVEHIKKLSFWKKFDYIGIPVTKQIYFSVDDLNCTLNKPYYCMVNSSSNLFIANRLNPAYVFRIPEAYIIPKEKLPLKICEENIFKKKVWQGGLNWECDRQAKKDGQASIKLTADQFSDAETYSPLIKVLPNQKYQVSYWVKTQNLQPDNSQVYGRILAAQYNSKAKETEAINQNRIDPGFSLGENIQNTTDWVKKSYIFQAMPNTRYIRLRAPMGLQGKAKGAVWFDEVKIEKLEGVEGDLNGDGVANGSDVKILLSKYQTGDTEADFNSDKIVNGIDFWENLLLFPEKPDSLAPWDKAFYKALNFKQ